MKTLTLGIADRAEVTRRALEAFKGKPQGSRLSFATPELLWSVMSERRWELVRMMTGAEPMSLREAARRVGRDVKQVHGDAQGLLEAGVLRKTDDGKLVLPFDAVKVDFTVKAERQVA